MSEDPLRSVAERLYGLAPGEFTPARDAEAKAVRADGDRAAAERIGRLRKPSTAAWVVNMLMRHRAEQMGQLLDLGESLRQAQADLDADALRELTRQRRRLVAAVAGDGRALARELGQKVSEQVGRQVEDTLHAAMVDTDAATAVRTGMLLDPLTPAGLGSLKAAGAVSEHTAVGLLDASGTTAGPAGRAEGSRPGLAAVPDAGEARSPATRSGGASTAHGAKAAGRAEQEERDRREAEERAAAERAAEERAAEERRRAVAEADRELAEAEDAADDARRRRRKAEKRVAKLEARGLQLQAEAEELRRRLAEVEHEAEALDEETSEAEDRRDTAVEREAEASERLEEAQQRRADLGD